MNGNLPVLTTREFPLFPEFKDASLNAFPSYTAAEQSGTGFKLFISLDMSYGNLSMLPPFPNI